ncbi:MAG: hypothetical protein L3J09_08650 [Flavobacteriaceae bacterium]|nr:hypothetical protein [Flavobacteriaceae bacterium]
MKIITLTIILSLWFIPIKQINAQDVSVTIKTLESNKEKIIEEEKEALKKEVEAINLQLENEEITQTESDELKSKAAEKHALNIENRVAIVENKIELRIRNNNDTISYKDKNILLLRSFEDGEVFSVSYNAHKKYDRRTTSRLVVAVGFNNLITEGESFNDTEIKIGGSRFFELGWAWKTRVFKDSNWLRIKYGFSFTWDGLKPEDNQYYVDTGEETVLQVHSQNLDKAKLRVDKLIFPVHFEFGPSKKKEHPNYFRYSTRRQFKYGIGGFAGFKLSSRQKLKYSQDGSNKKEKIKASYNTNSVVYGLSSYVGWGWTALYIRYELNPIFKNNPIDQRNVSMGLRFDM